MLLQCYLEEAAADAAKDAWALAKAAAEEISKKIDEARHQAFSRNAEPFSPSRGDGDGI